MNTNKIIFTAILAIGVYATIVLLSDTHLLYQKFATMHIYSILIALGLFSTGYFIRSFRWISMLRFMKINIPIGRNMMIYYTGYAFSLTPGKVGEAMRSKYLKDDFGVALEKSVPTIFTERYYDVMGVVVIALLTFGLSKSQSFFIFVSMGLLVLVYFAVKKKIIIRLLSPLKSSARLCKISSKIVMVSENLDSLLKPKIFLVCFVLTIVSWVIESTGAYFVFNAFDIQTTIPSAIFDYVLSALVGASSFLPGGIGGTEGSLIGLLLSEGHNYNQALGPVLMIRIFALWYVILIGLFFTFVYKLKYTKAETRVK